jgi:hypothetical protein
MSDLIPVLIVVVPVAGWLADAWLRPWLPCSCQGRKCARCRWAGKRPKMLARVVRRAHLRDEGWLK